MNIPCDSKITCECAPSPLTSYSSEEPEANVFTCENRITCPCTTNPITNFSSEDPDRFVWLGRKFSKAVVPPLHIPATDSNQDCSSFSGSTNSQEDADYCADNAQQECETQQSAASPCDICNGSTQNNATFGIHSTEGSGSGCCDPDSTAPAECCCDHTPSNPNDPPVQPPPGGGGPHTPPGGGGRPPQSYPNTPQTCTKDCGGGQVISFTAPAGRFVALSQAWANQLAYNYACEQLAARIDCTPGGGGDHCHYFCYGDDVDFQVSTVLEGYQDVVFEIINGELPLDLGMDTLGNITGTVYETGRFDLTVKAIVGDLATLVVDVCINVMGLDNHTLPNGTTGTAYSATLTASGGTGPYTYTASGLPTGLTCSAAGVISGTPIISSGVNDYAVDVTITDSTGRECNDVADLHINNGASFALNLIIGIQKDPGGISFSGEFVGFGLVSGHGCSDSGCGGPGNGITYNVTAYKNTIYQARVSADAGTSMSHACFQPNVVAGLTFIGSIANPHLVPSYGPGQWYNWTFYWS